ncbi:MAG: Holliday junction branch migration protein RuvA [Flavobacteriales bacterium]|nr:Holliday junction branch migration protein RuvA [Flavobacteriales bacterium]
MIEYLKGKLVEKNPTNAIVECSGLAYFLNISLNTFSSIPEKEDIKLFVHFVVREDAHILYGFFNKEEREIFRMLISVNGVGVNTARIILSTLTPRQAQEAILAENVDLLKSVKGIGAKTAQRIILDLRDKVGKDLEISEISSLKHNNNKEEALSALEVLGFATKPSIKAVEGFLKDEPGLTVEELIKNALKVL